MDCMLLLRIEGRKYSISMVFITIRHGLAGRRGCRAMRGDFLRVAEMGTAPAGVQVPCEAGSVLLVAAAQADAPGEKQGQQDKAAGDRAIKQIADLSVRQ